MKKLLWVLCLAIVGMVGCKDDDIPMENNENVKESTRTILAYMVSNSDDENLDAELKMNIADMYNGLAQCEEKTNLMIYFRPKQGDELIAAPSILEYKFDGIDKINGKMATEATEGNIDEVIKLAHVVKGDYPNSQLATAPETMREILRTMVEYAKAERYGLVFNSQGTSWMPTEASSKSRAFGNDAGTSINMPEMANVLRGTFADASKLDFILMDADMMGNAEVAYDLRNCAKYFIASTASVPAEGFPYKEIMPMLYDNDVEDNMQKVCREYEKYYKNTDEFVTCSAYDLEKMEKLAGAVKSMLSKNRDNLYGKYIEDVQVYGKVNDIKEINNKYLSIDVADYFRQMNGGNLPEMVREAIEDVVVGKGFVANDGLKYHYKMEKELYSGISMFVPNLKDFSKYAIDYNKLYNSDVTGWYNAVNWNGHESEAPVQRRTLLSYYISNNHAGADLDVAYKFNLTEMYNGLVAMETDADNLTLLVYYRPNMSDPYITSPSILKYEYDRKAGEINGRPFVNYIDSTTVVMLGKVMKTYPRDQVATTPESMKQVLSDMVEIAKAPSYGLILSSHGGGWTPGIYPEEKTTQVDKSFGDDNTYSIGMIEMSKVLKEVFNPGELDYILFDACVMGGAEVCYDIKDCAKYCLASTASVPGLGFPYGYIMEYLYQEDAAVGLMQAAYTYKAFYIFLFDEWEQNSYVTSTVIDLSKMDKLADVVARLLAENKDHLRGDFLAKVQAYGSVPLEAPHPVYKYTEPDLVDYFRTMYDGEVPAELEEVMSDVVIYKNLYNNNDPNNPNLDEKKYCGLSMFIPDFSIEGYTIPWFNRNFNEKATTWYNAVQWGKYRK